MKSRLSSVHYSSQGVLAGCPAHEEGRGFDRVNYGKQSQFAPFWGEKRGSSGKTKPNKANFGPEAQGAKVIRTSGAKGGDGVASFVRNKANCRRFWLNNAGGQKNEPNSSGLLGGSCVR